MKNFFTSGSSVSGMELLFWGLLAAGIATTSAFLFFFNQDVSLFNDVVQAEPLVREEGILTFAYDQPLATYEPTVSGVVQRQYLANVYEGLVRFDRDFNLEPALALSWGMLDETTWQFKLRPGVLFHDGTAFDANDVVASLARAQTHSDSGLVSLVSRIRKVQVVDLLNIQIFTDVPDPTLPSKLTLVPMVPQELAEDVSAPLGTGPYAFVRQGGMDEWQFERFPFYWGPAPSYPLLVIRYIPDKFDRYESFVSGDLDVLAQVPPVFVSSLLTLGYPVASLPSLEVSFFLFDTQGANSPFRYAPLRQALRHVFNPDELITLTSGYAHPVSQFVSRGVFGYDSSLKPPLYDLDMARALVADYADRVEIVLDLPSGMEALGIYTEAQLEAIGLLTSVHYWSMSEYQALVDSGGSDFFFLAWRSDLADAGTFFDAFSDFMDEPTETIGQNLLESIRLKEFQSLMASVVEEQVLGIPLFESDTLVGVQKEFYAWEPRMDNLILAADFQ